MRGHGLDLMFRWNFLLHLHNNRLAYIPYLKHMELVLMGRDYFLADHRGIDILGI